VADNPFELKHFGLLAALGAEPRRNSLLDYVTPPSPKPEPSPLARAVADLLMDKPTPALPVSPCPYASGLGNLFGTLAPAAPTKPPFNALATFIASPSSFPPSPPARPFGLLADLAAPPALSPFNALYSPPPKPKPVAPATKRKAFFSFQFDDIMRVNNVRNAWKITHPDSSLNRSFYDSSLWEDRKLVAPESIKQLIRLGVLRTSVVCVLAGSITWDRRWVRYEIARAVVDGRGLLTVHLNNINHHQTKNPHPRGRNPLSHMGVAKLQPNKRLQPQYYLYEMKLVSDGYGGVIEQWSRYSDYTAPVKKPPWLTDPDVDHVMALSVNAAEYDYELDYGHRNIGSWIDKAAKQAGR
jgi:MTH538 TIR-like domain (DUF1863)